MIGAFAAVRAAVARCISKRLTDHIHGIRAEVPKDGYSDLVFDHRGGPIDRDSESGLVRLDQYQV